LSGYDFYIANPREPMVNWVNLFIRIARYKSGTGGACL
jgi:hypothetical protein